MGGFGLMSAESLAPAAYIAGVEVALRLSPVFLPVWSGSVPLPPLSPLYRSVSDSLQRIHGTETALLRRCGDAASTLSCAPPLLPTSADTFVSHFSCISPLLVQSAITYRISILLLSARAMEAAGAGARGVEVLAKMSSLSAAKSSLWLHTLPRESFLRLTDEAWRWAAQLRLGMPVPASDYQCTACNKDGAYIRDPWHALSCKQQSGEGIIRRHNAVLNQLARFCQLMLVPTTVEPAHLDENSQERPDLQVDLPERTLLVDVTIVTPTAPSYRGKAATRSVGVVGDERACGKTAKYSDMTKSCDAVFTPIVIYADGGLHASAKRALNMLANAVDPTVCQLSKREWKRELQHHIAMVVQRGNARIMMDAVRRDRLARHPPCNEATKW